MGSPTDTDFAELIPELPAWNNGDGIDVDSWLGCKGDFQLAIAFSRLFWPAFAEHDGCVLFSSFSPAIYSGCLASCHGDRSAVEALLNHQHILHFFYHAAGEATAKQLIYLGRVLKEIYTIKLKHDFPSRTFTVAFDEGPFNDLEGYQITFWQPANRLGA